MGNYARVTPASQGFCHRKSARTSGFTLIEILVAVTIMATGLVLVIEAMVRNEQSMRAAENLILASQIAEDQIAESEIEIEQVDKLTGGRDAGRVVLPGKVFTWEKNVDQYTHPTITDETRLQIVHAKVEWSEGHRKNGLDTSTLILSREEQKLVTPEV